MPHTATIPFHLRRSEDVMDSAGYTSTTEIIHGLLRLDGDRLVVQWRVARQTDHMGEEIRTDREVEAVREVMVPVRDVAGAFVRRRWWQWFTGPRLVLTAADLRAFEGVAGEAALQLSHPAELVLRIRRADRLAAEEFSAELALAVAQRAVQGGPDRRRIGDGDPATARGPSLPRPDPGETA